MGKIVKAHQPCIDPDCGSSDARQIYEDGTSFCFSCQKWFPKGADEDFEPVNKAPKVPKIPSLNKKLSILEIKELPIRGFRERDITKTVTEFFGVKVSYNESGEIDTHYYPYDNGTAFKIRKLPKNFVWANKSSNLFGIDKFNGGGRRVVVTEGEIDALSVAQASLDRWGKIYPVVALSSSVMTKSLLENRDWLRSFKEVVLCMDEDEAGEKAKSEAIRIIGFDKVKIAKLPENDPNDILVKHGSDRLNQVIFDAAPYVPAGIIGKEKLWESLEEYNSIASVAFPECLEGVNTKTKGKRLGEITLFISGTGSGKSTIIRECILDDVKCNLENDEKVGIIALEEGPPETARKLAGMAINRNPAKEEIPLDELKIGFDQVFGEDKVLLLDHHGSITDNSLVDQLEYMCLMGCKYIYIDHITILVSEGVEDLRGNEAQDKIMNDLLRLVKRYPVWIGLISHLRKAPGGGKTFEEGKLPSIDDIRGSGSIKQISFDIVAFARNMIAVDEVERNTILMQVLKCRYTGLTGNVKGARYIYETGRLQACKAPVSEEFHVL
jgi:twinkle protein